MKHVALPFCLVLVLSCITACMPYGLVPPRTSAFENWKAADLRYLQAPDSDPQHSLIAVYQRQADFDLQIRLDVLDLTPPLDFDLYLAFDTRPGGSTALPMLGIQSGLAYELLIKIPADGLPEALDENLNPLPNLIPRTANHPGLGILTVSLNRGALPGSLSQWGLQVFLTAAGKNFILSETPAIFPTHTHPRPAPLLLVFWDSLPAASPAQTLRRWEGAHTGPLGGRHGLSVLLQAAHDRQIPLVLADLLQPASLTGLSAAGGRARVRAAAWGGDVLLAETAFGDPQAWQVSQSQSRNSAQQGGLPAGSLAFGAFTPALPGAYSSYFANLADRSHVVFWQGKRLVPLPTPVYRAGEVTSEPQLTQAGLSLAVRQALLNAALSDDPTQLVVLGGSLPESAWGDLSAAPAAFAYIATHPWILPLRAADLQTFPALPAAALPLPVGCHDLLCTPPIPEIIPVTGSGQPAPSGISLPNLRLALRRELETLPPGTFSQSAWQSYLALTAPTADARLAGLQANALGQIGYLALAARWNNQPAARSDCTLDLDYDGLPECVLASDTWLAVLKLEGGRLVFAAQRSPHAHMPLQASEAGSGTRSAGAAQWVGAAAQFGVGLSDPTKWQPQLGPAGDPADIPGAFAPQTGSGLYAQFTAQSVRPGQINLRAPDGSGTRTFTISGLELRVVIQSNTPQTLRIPITLPGGAQPPAPQLLAGEQWLWQPPSGPGLRIRVQGAETLASTSCLDSAEVMTVQENPNRAYPPGHYLPYPLAVLEAQGSQVNFIFSAP